MTDPPRSPGCYPPPPSPPPAEQPSARHAPRRVTPRLLLRRLRRRTCKNQAFPTGGGYSLVFCLHRLPTDHKDISLSRRNTPMSGRALRFCSIMCFSASTREYKMRIFFVICLACDSLPSPQQCVDAPHTRTRCWGGFLRRNFSLLCDKLGKHKFLKHYLYFHRPLTVFIDKKCGMCRQPHERVRWKPTRLTSSKRPPRNTPPGNATGTIGSAPPYLFPAPKKKRIQEETSKNSREAVAEGDLLAGGKTQQPNLFFSFQGCNSPVYKLRMRPDKYYTICTECA